MLGLLAAVLIYTSSDWVSYSNLKETHVVPMSMSECRIVLEDLKTRDDVERPVCVD